MRLRLHHPGRFKTPWAKKISQSHVALNNRTINSDGRKPISWRAALSVLVGLAALVVLASVLIFGGKTPPVKPDATPDAARADAADPSALGAPQATGRPGATQPGTQEQGLVVLVRVLKDTSLPMSERRKAIKALAQNGSREALAALKEALSIRELRAALAEDLRDCASPECTTMLLALLNDPDEAVSQASIRSLAKQGSPEAATALLELLGDSRQSSNLRCDAALGLGGINQFGVSAGLAQAARQIDDEDVVTAVIKSLGSRDFGETESFFQEYLTSPDVSPEVRVTAIEALAGADGDPTALLTKLAADPDADARVAAAWALSTTAATGNAGPQLLSLLQTETDPDVRLRLYQALRNQESFDVASALALVQQETDPSARIAGLDLLAKTLRDNPSPALAAFFDQTATAELKQAALAGENEDDRQAAIVALTRARTAAARAALQELASQLAPPPQAASQAAPSGRK